MTDRLLQTEETLAHLVRTVDDLNEVVTAQAAEVTRLKRLVQLLMEREAEREADAGGAGSIPLADQRPPHW